VISFYQRIAAELIKRAAAIRLITQIASMKVLTMTPPSIAASNATTRIVRRVHILQQYYSPTGRISDPVLALVINR
jgi:hypothetical protein